MKTLKEMIIAKEGITVEVAKYINNEIKLADIFQRYVYDIESFCTL